MFKSCMSRHSLWSTKLKHTFELKLATTGGQAGTIKGSIDGQMVSYGASSLDDDNPTLSAVILFDDGRSITLTGDAWRAVENANLDKFILVASLNIDKAQMIADIARKQDFAYKSLVVTNAIINTTVFSDRQGESVQKLAKEQSWDIAEGDLEESLRYATSFDVADVEKISIAELIQKVFEDELDHQEVDIQERQMVSSLEAIEAAMVKAIHALPSGSEASNALKNAVVQSMELREPAAQSALSKNSFNL